MTKRPLWGMSRDEFSDAIAQVPVEDLRELAVDVYVKLVVDAENGQFSEEYSQAGMSAADFVESCNFSFQRLYAEEHVNERA